jgi:hypothetical protein
MSASPKIIPPTMPFDQALRFGYTGEIRMPRYLEWIRTLPCDHCKRPAPSQASHPNFYKSQKNKGPDPLALPECPACHAEYERNGYTDEDYRMQRAAIYMLRAIWEGRLKWAA